MQLVRMFLIIDGFLLFWDKNEDFLVKYILLRVWKQ